VPYVPCTGLYGSAQCCATDVLGVADLDCGLPPTIPTSADSFSATCSTIGQRARCCVLPIVCLSPKPQPYMKHDANYLCPSLTRASCATPLLVSRAKFAIMDLDLKL